MPALELPGVQFTPLATSYLPVRHLGSIIGFVSFIAVLAVPLILRWTDVWPDFPAWLAWGLPGVGVVWMLIQQIIIPRQVRAMGYAEREDDLLWRSGILFRSVQAVPYGRLQYVDVEDGPVMRRFGLQSVSLKTASGSADVTIPGVTRQEADRLREVLMARGQARLAGL